jgi:hypothetical protein
MIKAISFLLTAVAVSAFKASFNKVQVSPIMMAEKSKSLPFLPQPVNTVGLAGDVGM